MEGILSTRGTLVNRVVRGRRAPLSWKLRNSLRWYFIKGWLAWRLAPVLARLLGLTAIVSSLAIKVRKANGQWVDYGIVGYRVVTTVGVNAMALAFITPASPGNFYYHGIGTGGAAEGVGNTALTTEITTEYAVDNTRPTGTHVQGASANIYQTVGTNTVDGSVACTEHGVFNQAATGGGTLLDRTLFSVINLASGDSLVSTYNLTFTAGG